MKTFYCKPLQANLTVVSMGTADFGNQMQDEQGFALLDTYVGLGGNLIDTAHMYADWEPGVKSSSERQIGRWLQKRGGRQNVYIASKGGHPDMSAMHISRLSPEDLAQDLDEGLLYTGLDYFDMYYLHRDDTNLPVSQIMDCMNEQITRGKIRALGCSNWRSARIAEANAYAESKGLQGFTASQIMFSAAAPNDVPGADPTLVRMDKAEFDFYEKAGMLLTSFTSQAKGYLTKRAAGAAVSDGVRAHYDSERNDSILKIVQEIAAAHRVSVTTVSLAYIWSQAFDAIPILGCHTSAHIADCMQNCDFTLTADEVAAVNAVRF